MKNDHVDIKDTKQVFRQCGTCSRTFAYILDRTFGNPKGVEENALDPLAGGIANQGHQCGMLWGAAFAIGAEAYRRFEDPEMAISAAIRATQHTIGSFTEITDTVNCREIIGLNLSSIFGLARFMIRTTVKGTDNSQCFNLAEQWAPEAIRTAQEGLSKETTTVKHRPVSCASEVAKRMGATNEEAVMVAGFAGGLGLGGHACGALSAAIWMKMLEWCKEHSGKTPPFLNNPTVKQVLKAFREETKSEMLCHKITGRRFATLDDHYGFINSGGCEELIEVLAKS